MTDDSKQIVMDAKYARIIMEMSQMYGVSLEEATDIFYNSEIAELVQDKWQTYIVAVTNIWRQRLCVSTRSKNKP